MLQWQYHCDSIIKSVTSIIITSNVPALWAGTLLDLSHTHFCYEKVVSHSVMQTVGLGLILQGDKLDVGQFSWAGRLYAHCSRLDNFLTV